MWVKGRHFQLIIGATEAPVTLKTIGATASGAQLAIFHHIPQFQSPSSNFALPAHFQVWRKIGLATVRFHHD
jgi:hypothetical protein